MIQKFATRQTALQWPRLVWQQILFIDSELNDIEALLNDSEDILSIFPNQPIPYYFNGIAKSQSKKYEKAIKMFDRSLKLAGENNLLKAQRRK